MESQIILAKGISIDRNYKNVLDYSVNNMLALLRSTNHFVAEYNDYNFIRGGQISVQIPYDVVLNSNYIAFQNKEYTNKWFFAWIEDVEFVNPNTTRITYTEDVWTTWRNDWTANQCYVVREHVNDDTIGLNTIPENLACDEFVCENYTQIDNFNDDFRVVIESDWEPDYESTAKERPLVGPFTPNGRQYSDITKYTNIVNSHHLYIFTSVTDLERYILRTNRDGHIEDIKNMYFCTSLLLPREDMAEFVAYAGYEVDESTKFKFYYPSQNLNTIKTITKTLNKITSYNNLTIRNNKCFTYPYNYLLVSNNNGNNNIYKYEDFNTSDVNFNLECAITTGISGKLIPLNYKNMLRDDDESLPLGKFPTLNWSGDAYTNWLTKNAVNETTQLIGGAFAVGQSIVEKEIPTAIANVGKIVANNIGQHYSASLLPNISGGQNTSDVTFANKKNNIIFKQMRSKDEYIKIIDDYFTRFGYKINRVKVPNLTGRSRFNYVEINQGEDIVNGNVPVKYLEEINNICSSGVTIWHNHSYIGDYLTANPIV